MSYMKETKRVLILDDDPDVLKFLKSEFESWNGAPDCPYEFSIELVDSAAACVEVIRTHPRFDVIVFDKLLDQNVRNDDSGLRLALSFFIPPGDGGSFLPVRIVFTAFDSYPECVEAIRGGVWDYVPKSGANYNLVVKSALDRLRQLDLHVEREKAVSTWLAVHMRELEADYQGRLVALWHDPQVKVVANGIDSFELVEGIRNWKRETGKETWQEPTVLAIRHREAPLRRGD